MSPRGPGLVHAVALIAVLAGGAVRAPARASAAGSWASPTLGAEFVRLGPGEFRMGSPVGERGRETAERLHPVVLTRPFWIARTEVTQAQWRAVVGDAPSQLGGCDACPVETVSARAVERFLARLARLEPDERYRLPTEAEWEFACRAGGGAAYGDRSVLRAADANFDARYPVPGTPAEDAFPGRPLPVGTYPARGAGLFDIAGNVWEWTSDRYCPYPDGPAVDPLGTCDTELLVIRGGSWAFGADAARCAMRYTHAPEHDGPSLGLRLVREEPEA